MTNRGHNTCEYVIRRAGYSVDGRPIGVGYGGDTAQVCGQFGSPVPHTYHVKRPGITTLYDAVEGTTIRCPKHKDG